MAGNDRLACLLACVLVVAAPASAGDRTTRDGAFTAAQAERGRAVYETSCLSCHQLDFYVAKLAVWEGASVSELFEALAATMPSENPGGLTNAQYLDVLAYILSITGSPAGEAELTAESISAIEIVTATAQPAPP